jgi:hypothetical protein
MSDPITPGENPMAVRAGFKEPFLHITYYCGYVLRHIGTA